MKKSLLLRMTPVLLGGVGLKTFVILAMMLGIGCGSAMADTIETMGDVDKTWTDEGCSTSYTLASNKTLTLSFTVSSTKGENETQGYHVAIVQPKDADHYIMEFQPGGGFYYWGDPWWNENHIVKNDRSWGDLSEFTSLIPGATVELTIKRVHSQLLYFADITTSTSVRHYRRLITKENSFDENENIEVKLGANYAVLTGISDEISDESITGTLIGKEDNSVDFNGEGAVNQSFTLGTDKSLTLNFINYSSKIGYGDNWLIEIQNGTKYLDLRADYFGWDANMDVDDHYFYRTLETTSPGYFTLSSTSGDYWKDFPKALHKATVELTVTRSGSNISITAVQKCTSGELKTQTYTLTHSDFASGDVTVRLFAAYSHLDLLPVTAEVSTYGWATFSSDYALDFSKASDGLTAYKITGHSGNVVTKEEVTGTVPAGTGLLLKGSAGSYNIPIVGSSATGVADNLLVAGTGASVSAEAGKTRYVLGVNGSAAEFQKITSTPATVAKGKAYLQFNEEIAARALSFEDESTGVMAIDKVQPAVDNVYDLSGRKIVNGKSVNGKLQRGLYIVNGKKVVVK